MTKVSTTTVCDQTTDAGFRAWGSEFSTQMAACGMVQTSDTGQINWTTVTRAASNTMAGYEIWRFADSTLYLKLEYGSASANTSPSMYYTVGTGSNGSGTLTGQLSSRNRFLYNTATSSVVTNYTSRWCHVADAFAVCWKEAGMGAGTVGGLLVVGKTVDGTGAATTVGYGVLRAGHADNFALGFQSVRLSATAATYTETSASVHVPGAVTASLVAGVAQAYDIWMNVPQVLPFNWANVIIIAEAARDTSFSVAQVGTTPRTYLSVGQTDSSYAPGNSAYAPGTYGVGMIWE